MSAGVSPKALMTPSFSTPVTHMLSTSRAKGSCSACGEIRLRRSRLRRSDLRRIVLGEWPVRCTHCSLRQFVNWYRAAHASPAHHHAHVG